MSSNPVGDAAGAAARTVDRVFQVVPPEELLARAIVDPRWERILLSRAPSTPAEMRSYAKSINRLLAAEAGTRAAAVAESGD